MATGGRVPRAHPVISPKQAHLEDSVRKVNGHGWLLRIREQDFPVAAGSGVKVDLQAFVSEVQQPDLWNAVGRVERDFYIPVIFQRGVRYLDDQ